VAPRLGTQARLGGLFCALSTDRHQAGLKLCDFHRQARGMLTAPFRWVDFEDTASFYFNSRLVAGVRCPGAKCGVRISSRRELRGPAASVKQGKRHVERWIRARRSAFPPLLLRQ